MAQTSISTTAATRKQVWEEKLFRNTIKASYFGQRLIGDAFKNLNKGDKFESSANDIVQVKTNLEAVGKTKLRKGDKITFALIPEIDETTYPGVTSGQTLEGKEVPFDAYDFDIELKRYRQAVSAGGPMDWHRASWNVPEEAEIKLTNWGAKKVDVLCFNALGNAPTVNFYKVAGKLTKASTYATAKAEITAVDKLSPAMVSAIKTWAKTGGARSQDPLIPVNFKGKDYLVLLVHPDVLYDWKNDSTVFQAMREAEVRGSENPIFTGASYVWDGVIIHESERITIGTDAGAGAIPYAKCHLLGAQALCWAWGERPSIIEYTKDAEEELYYAWRMTAAVEKPVFNGYDFGSICVIVARTNVSGL